MDGGRSGWLKLITARSGTVEWTDWVQLVVALIVIFGIISGGIWATRFFGKEFWVSWEVSALVFTTIYCAVMFGEWFVFGEKLDDVLTSGANGCAILLAISGLVAFFFAVLLAVIKPHWFIQSTPLTEGFISKIEPYWLPLRAFVIISGTLCFLLINWIITRFPRNNLNEPQILMYRMRRSEAATALYFGDLPTVVAFIAIGFFLLSVSANEFVVGNEPIKHRDLDAFFGGCVAFQLLASNAVFGAGQCRSFIEKLRQNSAE